MIGKIVGATLIILAFVVIIGGPLTLYFTVNVPAEMAYNNKFGSNVVMLTQGSYSLTGDEGSMEYYLMQIWNEMNATWPNTEQWSVMYANPESNFFIGTIGEQVPHNTLAEVNRYFNSLNATIHRKQAIIDNGSWTGSGDPVQVMINQIRNSLTLSLKQKVKSPQRPQHLEL